MITKRDDIPNVIKAYMSQHETTTVEDYKVKRLQSKNGYAQIGKQSGESVESVRKKKR